MNQTAITENVLEWCHLLELLRPQNYKEHSRTPLDTHYLPSSRISRLLPGVVRHTTQPLTQPTA